jgi:RimJ/RimL family protein N-acetyltransferase
MFIPGKILQEFVSKSGKPIAIRCPKEDDAEKLLVFINPIAVEDTFTNINNHVFTLEEEQDFVERIMREAREGNSVYLFVEHEGIIVGAAHVGRKKANSYGRHDHVGVFGITVAKDFRGDGIGKVFMETVIAEAKKEIPGLRMIELHCFSTNTAGLALYEKLGFKECGRLPGGILHRGEYVDNVNMVLELKTKD